MKFTKIKVRDLVEGYSCNAMDTEAAVTTMNGSLCIRPKYQRSFCYDDERQGAVIDTIIKKCPLGLIYWVELEKNKYELLDGQQRITSICRFIKNGSNVPVSNGFLNFEILNDKTREEILDYELLVYIMEKKESSQKLQWFERINQGGLVLNQQEILNAIYTGEFITEMRQRFSSNSSEKMGFWRFCAKVCKISHEDIIRQKGLEMILKMGADHSDDPRFILAGINIHDASKAQEFEDRCKKIFKWALEITKYISPCKELQLNQTWEALYDEYHNNVYDPEYFAEKFNQLMADEEVTNKKGIIYYLLDEEKYQNKLSIRAFSESDKKTKYAEQKGICPKCGKEFKYEEMAGDHIVPWSAGGKTVYSNLQMLCKHCNGVKSNN